MTSELQPPAEPGPDRPDGSGTGTALLAGFGGVVVTVALSFLFIMGGLPSGAFAGILAGIVFVGGGALCLVKSLASRGFGIGMMVGWAILSITTAGICTGLTDLHS